MGDAVAARSEAERGVEGGGGDQSARAEAWTAFAAAAMPVALEMQTPWRLIVDADEAERVRRQDVATCVEIVSTWADEMTKEWAKRFERAPRRQPESRL